MKSFICKRGRFWCILIKLRPKKITRLAKSVPNLLSSLKMKLQTKGETVSKIFGTYVRIS